MLVIGDSVLLGAESALRARLWGVPMTFFAQESFSTSAAPTVIDFNRAAIGDVTILALGNNDGADPAYFSRAIDRVMAALGPVRKVLWVNLRQFRAWVPAANVELNAAAQRYPNLQIVDWDGRSTPDPSLVYADGLHLDFPGRDAMAALIGDAYDQAVRELGAPAPAPAAAAPSAVAPPRTPVVPSVAASNAVITGAPAETAGIRVAAARFERTAAAATTSGTVVTGTNRGIDVVLTALALAALVAAGVFVRRLVVVRHRVMIQRRRRLDHHSPYPHRSPGL